MTRHRFYIGRVQRDGKTIVRPAAWRKIESYLLRWFTGFTRYEAWGGWRDSTGTVVCAATYVYEAVGEGLWVSAEGARILANIADQAAVLWTAETLTDSGLALGGGSDG